VSLTSFVNLGSADIRLDIASGTSEHTQTVINAGAVPYFIQLLSANNADVREQAYVKRSLYGSRS
jgi:importin subunit alpha-1